MFVSGGGRFALPTHFSRSQSQFTPSISVFVEAGKARTSDASACTGGSAAAAKLAAPQIHARQTIDLTRVRVHIRSFLLDLTHPSLRSLEYRSANSNRCAQV